MMVHFYTVAMFRKTLKDALDKVYQGDEVYIKRGDETYRLTLDDKRDKQIKEAFHDKDRFASVMEEATQEAIDSRETPASLYALARHMETELAEKLKYNQDPENRSKMEREGKEKIQEVWDKYHAAKAQGE